MPWKYNPFTDALDQTGSGGGTSYIDGDVEYHSNLPVTVGSPAVNSAFLVRKGEGLYFLTRKPAGIWVRELNNGNLNDWKYAGTFSDLYRDANFRIINDADVSKELAFSLSGITTGTTRTITMPDANVTLPNQGTSTGDSPTFQKITISGNEINGTAGAIHYRVSSEDPIGNERTPYFAVESYDQDTEDRVGFVLLGVRADKAFIQGDSADFRIEQFGGGLANIKASKLVLEDTVSADDPTATFDADGNLTANRTYDLPDASGTIALTSDFAAPPAIGSTTPAAGTFTTLAANTSLTLGTSGILSGGTNLIEQVNSTNAQTFRIYRTFTNASNYDRGFLRWSGTTLQIGAERLGSAGGPDLHLLRGSDAWIRLANNGMNVDTVLTVNSTFGPVINGGSIILQPTTGGFPAILARDAADILAMRNGTNAQEYRVYGTYTSGTNFQRLTIKTKAVTLSGLTGASVATTTGLIPDGAVLVGLTTRVSTAITGATGYDIGDGSDADRWGANVAIALNTSSDNRDWTAGTIECFTAAQEVTLTAVGSNFTGGAVVIVAHYLAGEAD